MTVIFTTPTQDGRGEVGRMETDRVPASGEQVLFYTMQDGATEQQVQSAWVCVGHVSHLGPQLSFIECILRPADAVQGERARPRLVVPGRP